MKWTRKILYSMIWKQWKRKRQWCFSQDKKLCREDSKYIPVQVMVYSEASVLEKHVHLELEISELVYPKTWGPLLPISSTQVHLLMVHCTAQKCLKPKKRRKYGRQWQIYWRTRLLTKAGSCFLDEFTLLHSTWP